MNKSLYNQERIFDIDIDITKNELCCILEKNNLPILELSTPEDWPSNLESTYILYQNGKVDWIDEYEFRDIETEGNRESIERISTLNQKIEKETVCICSNGSKELIGNINTSPSGDISGNSYKILDKSTGEVKAFNPGDINILNQPKNKLQEFLAGKKVEMIDTKGVKQLVGLNKTPLEWGISTGKQAINSADYSAAI